MTNPYAPPRAAVRDIADPHAKLVLADRGTRLGASMLDGVIFTAMVYLPFLVFGMVGAAATSRSSDLAGATGSLVVLGFALALVGFVVWCWMTIGSIRRNGQSLAKKMLGIKVVRKDGSPVSVGRIFWLRNLVIWLISLIPLVGVLDSLLIFGESRQCLHDKLADTIVVVA